MIQALALALLLAQDAQSSPQEFIKRYRAREQSIQTGMVQSTWEDFEKGQPTRRDRQTNYQDSLGRRRLQLQSETPQKDGTWIPHAQVPYLWDQLFDGELTASMTFDPRKDRDGSAPNKGAKTGYRSAQVFDGAKDVDQLRSALTFANGNITVLESALQNKIPIEVKNETEKKVAFHFTDDKSGKLWIFEADKSRDWIPTMIARVDQAGKAILRTELEYATTGTGFWYPKKGIHRYHHDQPESETPLWEMRFEVTECKINEPDFNEDIFKIVLHPDTAVSDLRYGVNYRIGTENTYTTQLAALAKSALDSQKANPDGLGERVPLTPPRDGRGRWILVWVNVAILAVIVAFVVSRRWMAK
ncbi:MAG: hypothetical protein AABP62_25510 [Planctomycetota bacterium]